MDDMSLIREPKSLIRDIPSLIGRDSLPDIVKPIKIYPRIDYSYLAELREKSKEEKPKPKSKGTWEAFCDWW
jgi:hypothetical protein